MPLTALKYIQMRVLVDPRWQGALKWSGTSLIAISAVIISFNPAVAEQSIAFFGFFCGHVLWSTMALIKRDWPLLAVNAGFLPIDIYAMYVRL